MAKLSADNYKLFLLYPDIFNWESVIQLIALTDEIIEKNINKFDFNELVKRQNLTEAILDKYFDKFPIDDIIRYQKMGTTLLNKNINKIGIDSMKLVFKYQKLPQEWIIKRLLDIKEHESVYKELLQIVVQYRDVDEAFLALFVDDLDMQFVTQHKKLSVKFIEANFLKFDQKDLLKMFENPQYSNINKIEKFNIAVLAENHTIDMDLLTKIFSVGDDKYMKIVIKRYANSEDSDYTTSTSGSSAAEIHTTIEGWIDDLDYWGMVANDDLSEDFIVRYCKKLNLVTVFNTNVYEEGLVNKIENTGRMLNPLEMYAYVSGMNDVPDLYGAENLYKANWISLVKRAKWWNFYDEVPDLTDFDMDGFVKNTKWNKLVTSPLPEWFMSYFADKLDWWKIPHYQRLSMDFIKKYIGRIDLEQVCIYQKLTAEFLREYKDFLPWDTISLWQPLTQDMINEFASYINFDEYKRNKSHENNSKAKQLTPYETNIEAGCSRTSPRTDPAPRSSFDVLDSDSEKQSDDLLFENCDSGPVLRQVREPRNLPSVDDFLNAFEDKLDKPPTPQQTIKDLKKLENSVDIFDSDARELPSKQQALDAIQHLKEVFKNEPSYVKDSINEIEKTILNPKNSADVSASIYKIKVLKQLEIKRQQGMMEDDPEAILSWEAIFGKSENVEESVDDMVENFLKKEKLKEQTIIRRNMDDMIDRL